MAGLQEREGGEEKAKANNDNSNDEYDNNKNNKNTNDNNPGSTYLLFTWQFA